MPERHSSGIPSLVQGRRWAPGLGEVHVFVGPDFVLTVRHSEAPDFRAVERPM